MRIDERSEFSDSLILIPIAEGPSTSSSLASSSSATSLAPLEPTPDSTSEIPAGTADIEESGILQMGNVVESQPIRKRNADHLDAAVIQNLINMRDVCVLKDEVNQDLSI